MNKSINILQYAARIKKNPASGVGHEAGFSACIVCVIVSQKLCGFLTHLQYN